MTTAAQPPRASSSFARVASAVVFVVGALVLLGWILGIAALTSVVPGWPKMVASTALAFVLAGVSLWLQASERLRAGAYVCAALAIFIGAFGVTTRLLGWNVRLDNLSIEKLSIAGISPAGSMSPATALSFVLVGSALLFARGHRFSRTYQMCAILTLLIGWLGFSRYIFGGEPLVPYAAMAIHTATLLLLLGAGVLSLRSDVGLMRLLSSRLAGGYSARRLLPAAILVPLIAGSLALYAERTVWLDVEGAFSLFALTSVIVFGVLAWINAAVIERTDLERQQAQRALEASEARTQLIIETALDAVITIDQYGAISGWSSQAETLFGWQRSEVIGRSLAGTIIPERYRDAHRNGLRRYVETGEARVLNRRIELSALHRDEHEFPVEIAITPLRIGESVAFSAFIRDITERERATAALRESQQLLQAIVDNSVPIIYVKDLDGRYLLVNRRFEEIFHRTRDTLLGRTDHDLFPKEAADAFRDMDRRVVAADAPLTEEEVAPHHDGPHDYLSVKAPLRDRDGRVYAVFGISTDITERKLAEQRLHAQLDRLNLLDRTTRAIGERQDLRSILQVVLRSLEDRLLIDFGCVCLFEPAQQALSVNCIGAKSQTLARELGLTEQSRIDVDTNGLARCVGGQLVYEPDTAALPLAFFSRFARSGLRSVVLAPLLVESQVFGVLIASRREPHGFTSGDCEFLRQLSQHVALAAHQAQLYTALQRAYDDLRESQQAILQQERLRALGQMASGIAHDINNALSPAALYAESLLERDPTLSPQARDHLGIIQRAIEGVSSTVARMREFYRPREHAAALEPVDLNRMLQQAVDLTRARWSDMPQEHGVVIEMQLALAADLPAIMGEQNEIRDAFTNLILNAVDAMPEGGTLTVRSRAETRTGMQTHVSVEICDTGMGMSEVVRSRCLEPFFTTKGDRGTGLGLAMVYGMVQRHNAEIEIESRLGVGTVVRLTFTAGSAAAVAREAAVVRSLQRLRILVIDDDPLLLESLQLTLEFDGHEVIAADGGQAGIDAFMAAMQRSERFSVVITDLGMPHVDGRAVAAAIKAALPATPILLLTGWGHRLQAENDLPEHVDRVLGKPPKLTDLRIALAELTAQS
jgi:PAS domain S-box-containing protein